MNWRAITTMTGALLLTTAAAWADPPLPPGYEGVYQITDDISFNRRPAINNAGQFVFAKWIVPFDYLTSEIFLYDNGELIRLTDDYVYDDFPDINDAGDIVWSRGIGVDDTYEIMLYRFGAPLVRLTDDDLFDYAPSINNLGWVAWHKYIEQGCDGSDTIVCLYDGESIQTITEGGWSDQVGGLNDHGDIVWTRFDFCDSDWTSEIVLYSDGVVTTLTDGQHQSASPRLNNNRQVAWFHRVPPDWEKHIQLWEDGVTTTIIEWGAGLQINDHGDIVFNRWYEDADTYQVWLYRDGVLTQLTDDPAWDIDGAINNHGDIAWCSGDPLVSDFNIKLMKRFSVADLNCDGLVNSFDVDPFVLALTDRSAYHDAHPHCDYRLADVNLDGLLNAFDIDPFVQVLTR